MQTGFVGLGAVVETAYLPALRHLGIPMNECWGFDANPGRRLPGITRCASLAAVLGKPLDLLFITTASLQHLPVLEAALASACPRIVVEKPVVATLEQMTRLRELLSQPQHARRVLALDHWMARDGALKLALGELDERWQGEDAAQPVGLCCHQSRISPVLTDFCRSPADLTTRANPWRSILPPVSRIRASCAILTA
jgi:hypothetical protein